MTFFWILWGIDAFIALIAVYFLLIGLIDGSVSSFNAGIWTAAMAALAVILLGSLWLKSHNLLFWTKALLLVLAIPGFLYGLFVLMMIIGKPRMN